MFWLSLASVMADNPTDAQSGDDRPPNSRKRAASSTPGYGGGRSYWDKRYRADPAPFEWLEGYPVLKGLIAEAAENRFDCRILHVGCGNSLLPEDMYDAGYRDIVNTDISPVAIELMAERNSESRPEMSWQVMDATSMDFPDDSFDVVIDKSVMDTMACGDKAQLVIGTYLKEVDRVLRPGGALLCISYGSPDTRLEHFRSRHLDFSTRQENVAGSGSHYAYLARKPSVPSSAPSCWEEVRQELEKPWEKGSWYDDFLANELLRPV